MVNINGTKYDELPIPLKGIIKKLDREFYDYSDIEIIRYVYLELGKMFHYSANYYYALPENAKAIELKKEKQTYGSDIDFGNTICFEMSEWLNRMLEVLNIDCKTRIDGSGPHVYNVANVNGLGKIKLDLQQDLTNIQSNKRTDNFASVDAYDGYKYERIELEELMRIDKKLGYITEDRTYTDDYVSVYLSPAINPSCITNEKMNLIFQAAKQYKNINNMEYVEQVWYYKEILNKLFPMKKGKRKFNREEEIQHITIKDKSKQGKMEYNSCFIIKSNEGSLFYMFEKNSYVQISFEDFLKKIVSAKQKELGRAMSSADIKKYITMHYPNAIQAMEEYYSNPKLSEKEI